MRIQDTCFDAREVDYSSSEFRGSKEVGPCKIIRTVIVVDPIPKCAERLMVLRFTQPTAACEDKVVKAFHGQ